MWLGAALVVGLLIGCAPPKAERLAENPGCASSVEGFFFTKPTWLGRTPAIVIRDGHLTKVKSGEIIELRDDGIVFDGYREGSLHDPDPRFYAYDELSAVVDEFGNVLHGDLPRDRSVIWGMEVLVECTDGSPEELRLVVVPNEPFAFCMPAGEYRITKMTFIDQHAKENVNESTELPDLRFTVTGESVDHVGRFRLVVSPAEEPGAIRIPYKVVSRQSAAAHILGPGIAWTAATTLMESAGMSGEGVYSLVIADVD